jgi:uncharacterized protein
VIKDHIRRVGLTMASASFEVYKDRSGEFRWRLRHSNGNVIATGGEGYKSKRSAMNGIDSVKKNAPDADTDDQTAG